MSLQVWLPLNGNLRNQGLNSFNFTTSTVGGYEAGKIGQALSLLNSKLVFTASSLTNATKFSMAFWYKPRSNSNLTGNWYNIISLQSKSADEQTTAYWRCESSYGNSYAISHHNNVGNPIDAGHGSLVSTKDIWYHICVTCDGISYTKAYVNGELISTKPYNGGHLTGWVGIADETNKPDGLLDDVRIYDHCLSQKEVEEIAKGLVLHYKLDDTQTIAPTTNLLGNKAITFSSGWSSYGFGSHGTIELDYDTPPALFGEVAKVTNNYANSTQAEIATSFTNPPLTNGKSVTVSAYVMGVGTTVGKTIHIHVYATNGTQTQSTGADFTLTDSWQRIYYTFTWNQSTATSANPNMYIYCVRNVGEYFYVSNCQAEVGTSMTPFTISDAGFANIAYDCSGYNNNGLIVGSTAFSTDTARYEHALSLGSSQYILVQNRPVDFLPKDAITVSLWQKSTSWGNPISCTEGGGWNFENSSGIRFPVYAGGSYRIAQSSVTPTSLNNSWHMITGTMDSSYVKIYIDGEEVGSAATGTTSGISYANNYLFIGAEAAGNTVDPASSAYTGLISDVRIYASALTAAQVLELYNTSATIDNKGNGYAREEVEGNKFSITKTGQFINGSIFDDDENITASLEKADKILKVNTFYEY